MRNRSPLFRPMRLLSVAATALMLVGCATTGGSSPSPTRSPEEPPSDRPSETMPADPSMPMGGIDEDAIADLLAAAAADANVGLDEVTVVTAEEVDWSDGAIGCPEPGMMYTQAIVPGYRVVLDIDGEDHHFHAAEGGEFFYCEDPQEPARN